MTLLGYARVSTAEQHLDAQLAELERAGVQRIWTDRGISGTVAPHARPGFAELLKYAREGDELVAWRLDRVSRNAADALALVEALDERGVTLRTLHDGITSRGTTGRLVFTILAAVATAEREVTLERQRAGIAQAKAQGRHLGRPRRLSAEQVELARRLSAEGQSVRQIALVLGCSPATAHRAVKD